MSDKLTDAEIKELRATKQEGWDLEPCYQKFLNWKTVEEILL